MNIKVRFFCTYIEKIKLATEKPILQLVKDYHIEFAVSIVKKIFFSTGEKIEVTGIHLEFTAFRNQACIFNMSKTPSKVSIN